MPMVSEDFRMAEKTKTNKQYFQFPFTSKVLEVNIGPKFYRPCKTPKGSGRARFTDIKIY